MLVLFFAGGLPSGNHVQLLPTLRREATGLDAEAVDPHPRLFAVEGHV